MSFLVSVLKPLAYISLPVILLRSIASTSPAGRYYARVTTYLGTMTFVAACSAFLAAGMSIVGRRFDTNFVVARTFYHLGKRGLDLEVVVEGEEHLDTRPAVLMANHQSMLDILVVGRLMPRSASIMAKQSLQYTPLGPFMTMSGAIFVDRGNNARAIRSLEAAGETMKDHKVSLWMFPEGTRHSSEVPDMLPLKKGGFHLAIQAGIPIIPIVTENYWRMYRQGVFDTGKLKVRVLPPISTTGLSAADVPELANRVRDQMLAVLREISVKVPSGSSQKTEDTSRDYPEPAPEESAVPIFDPSERVSPTHVPEPILEASNGSSASIASSSTSSHNWKSEASENGAETEEDEGMILVGRPS